MKPKYMFLMVMLLSLQASLGQELLWMKTTKSGASKDVVMDRSGHVYVTGHIGAYLSEMLTTVRYDDDDTGIVVWADTFASYRSSADAICLDDSGYVYVAGWADVGSNQNLIVIKYDGKTGEEKWHNHNLIQETTDWKYWIAADNNGGIYVASDSLDDFWLVKFNANDGSVAWTARIEGDFNETWRGMVLDASGNVYVSGTQDYGNCCIWTAKYSSDGKMLWCEQFNECSRQGCDGIDIDNDGNVYVVGTSELGSLHHPIILKYSNSGTLLWWQHHYIDRTQSCRDIVVHRPSGTAYITGYALISGDQDVFVHAVSSEGDSLWTSIYEGGPNWDEGYELGVTGKHVYVGGRQGEDILTLCYLRENGALQWAETIDSGYCEDIAVQAINGCDVHIVATGSVSSAGDGWITAKYYNFEQMMTGDPHALAYNGNRHLVRKPNSEELHLVYTAADRINYCQSQDGGVTWNDVVKIGDGKYPAITLSTDYMPSVTWTDDNGGLWYRRKITSGDWGDTCHLWNPIGVDALRLNSPPSIAIHASNPNTVHILVTRTGGAPTRDVNHRVEDYTFAITQPMQGTFVLIEQALGPKEPPLRSLPSIASCEVNNSLHATWQRVDTVCYAWKPKNNTWINWGWQFESSGLQSAHPFVETYGDSIYVVWQHLQSSPAKEDVYRAARHIDIIPPVFLWQNLSLTPNTVSLYPINASGFFTVFADEPYPPVNSNYEIYYKIKPEDSPVDISQTELKSIYPQAAARFSLWHRYLYTSWLDGNEEPYEIRFKKIEYIDPTKDDQAYLTSAQGNSLPSPYLVARDSFISDWQVPVDIGNTATTYQFPLVPGYAYKARAVFYHENSGPWSGRIRIDNNLQFVVTYNANVPETLECWIPPALYEDSVLTVSFSRIAGDFAAIGPIYIYRYEYDGGGGPMSQQNTVMNDGSIAIFPNPFKDQLHILNQTPNQDRMNLQLYDIAGRLVKRFDLPSIASFDHIVWDGIDNNGRVVPQGVYFLRIDNLDTGDIICRKVLMVK